MSKNKEPQTTLKIILILFMFLTGGNAVAFEPHRGEFLRYVMDDIKAYPEKYSKPDMEFPTANSAIYTITSKDGTIELKRTVRNYGRKYFWEKEDWVDVIAASLNGEGIDVFGWRRGREEQSTFHKEFYDFFFEFEKVKLGNTYDPKAFDRAIEDAQKLLGGTRDQ